MGNTAYFNVTPPNGQTILANNQGIVIVLTGPQLISGFDTLCLRLLVAAGYEVNRVEGFDNTSLQVGDAIEGWNDYIFVPYVSE